MPIEATDEIRRLAELIEQQNRLLARQIVIDTDWKHKLKMAAVAAFGGLVGATLLVSLVLLLLRPFEKIDLFKPGVDRIVEALEGRKK